MRQYITTQIEKETLTSVTCDICGKTFDDIFEIQEFHSIHFIGGYGSVFGDTDEFECDICQYCLKEKLGSYIREVQDED